MKGVRARGEGSHETRGKFALAHAHAHAFATALSYIDRKSKIAYANRSSASNRERGKETMMRAVRWRREVTRRDVK